MELSEKPSSSSIGEVDAFDAIVSEQMSGNTSTRRGSLASANNNDESLSTNMNNNNKKNNDNNIDEMKGNIFLQSHQEYVHSHFQLFCG